MTDISTTTALDIPRGDLVLVTISEEYAGSWEAPAAYRGEGLDVDRRTFYATHDDRQSPSDYVTLVVPETDDRSEGMWALNGTRYGLTLDGPHRGWDIRKAHVSLVVSPETAEGPSEASDVLPVTFTQADVDRLVREARAAKDREFAAWKEEASRIACEYADENSLCGEFERCMEDIGLQGRNRDYEVTVTFSLTVTARNEDEAEEEAASILRDDIYYRMSSADFDVEPA